MATVTPTPIMARPPAPPTISIRRGDRAVQAPYMVAGARPVAAQVHGR